MCTFSSFKGSVVQASPSNPQVNTRHVISLTQIDFVLQTIILLMGGVVSVIAVLLRVPGHTGAVVREANQHHKLSLGQADWSWEERTVPTILAYSAVHYMTKFITFQDAVQRYLAVPNHKVQSGHVPGTNKTSFCHTYQQGPILMPLL